MTGKIDSQQAERRAAYKARFAEAARLLDVLNHHVENLGHEDLTAINWGHIGSAGGLVEWLRISTAMVLDCDPADPRLAKAVAAYRKKHGLTAKKTR